MTNSKPVIYLNYFTRQAISWEEYETIKREVLARFMAGDSGVGDQILAQMLLDNEYRYHEVKQHHVPSAYPSIVH